MAGKLAELRQKKASSMLDGEQMDTVVGETDNKLMTDAEMLTKRLGAEVSGQLDVEHLWQHIGIDARVNQMGEDAHQYFLNQKEITRQQAFDYLDEYVKSNVLTWEASIPKPGGK